jgi:hypothetical protein
MKIGERGNGWISEQSMPSRISQSLRMENRARFACFNDANVDGFIAISEGSLSR